MPAVLLCVVGQRIGDRLAHVGQRGELHHAVDLLADQDVGQGVGLGQVDFVEARPAVDGLPMSAEEVIDGHGAAAALDQQLYGVRADVSGPAGNQDVHGFSLFNCCFTIYDFQIRHTAELVEIVSHKGSVKPAF